MSVKVDIIEGTRIAFNSLRNYRLRTFLTVSGVGIGVATLLAILGITQGMDTSFQNQVNSLGNASVYASKYPWISIGNWWEFRNRKNITIEDVEAVRLQCTRCATVVPVVDDNADVEFLGRTLHFVSITGSGPEWPEVSTYEVMRGRFLSESEFQGRVAVAVIGSDLADTLFPRTDPLGQTLRIAGRPYRVIGVFGTKGALLDNNQDLVAVIPYTTFRAYFKGRKSIDVGIRVGNPDEIELAEDQIAGILRRSREVPANKPDDFALNRPEMLANTYKKLTSALYAVALGIGAITLVVGGIGIMNIMLVSVKERTREIGVRRALGARKRTIIIQFIIEAVVVSAVGGALGTFVGLGMAKVVSWVTPLAATIQPRTVAFGILFGAVVGLVFGIWPAARAANLDPVEALREE